MIGEAELTAGLDQQVDLLQRIFDRTEDGREDLALEEYATNMGVELPALARVATGYMRSHDHIESREMLALVAGAATRWFLLGVVVGRDHRP